MKWVDYREKLGIGFSDNEKLDMFRNKVLIFIDYLYQNAGLNNACFNRYLYMIGEINQSNNFLSGYKLSMLATTSVKELISKCVAMCNTYDDTGKTQNKLTRKSIINFLKQILDDINIQYDIYEDNEGYFVFPKGAKELDNALVSQPLDWLKDYPLAQKAFITALKDYSNCTPEKASNVADNFRKALETFFQEFFNGNMALEKFKSNYGTYLKSKGIPAEISNNFETLLDFYTKFNNNYAKHHNKTTLNVLEYLMYQTGNIIRLLITLKNN